MALISTVTGQDPQGQAKPLPVAGLAKTTTTPLGVNQAWNTGIIPYNGNEAVHFAISSDVSGTYTIEYYLNNQLIGFMGNATIYDPAIVNSFQGALSGKGDSFKLTYTNGSTAQTRFYLEIRFGDDIQQTLRSMGIPMSSTNMGGTAHSAIEGRENGVGSYKQATVTESSGKVGQDVYLLNPPATQPVSGSVSISNLPATQPVSGTVNVGNFPTTQPVSGSVSVSNLPTTQPISAASLPLPTGAATEATLGSVLAALNSLNLDQGAPTDAQATNSTASWGEIALLKGILQRPPTGSTVTNTTLATVTTVLAANAARKGATLFSVTGTILILLGSGASATLFTARLITNGYYEVPFGYTGIITAIGAGTLLVTELT